MMPIVMQLQAAVRCDSESRFLPGRTAETHPDVATAGTLYSPWMLRAEDAWLREVVSRDPHLNVLVQCSDVSMTAVFMQVADLCTRPPCVCALPGALLLPDNDPGPLLIGDISTLTLPQQIELYDWLDRYSEMVQVLSITSVPLWPMVVRGRFLEGLFYRLNVLSVTAGAQED